MQLTLVTLALAALAVAAPNAEPLKKHRGPPRVNVPFPVCGGATVAACCQVEGITPGDGLQCLGAGNPTSSKKFAAICAASGRTPECCDDLTDATGTGCSEV